MNLTLAEYYHCYTTRSRFQILFGHFLKIVFIVEKHLSHSGHKCAAAYTIYVSKIYVFTNSKEFLWVLASQIEGFTLNRSDTPLSQLPDPMITNIPTFSWSWHPLTQDLKKYFSFLNLTLSSTLPIPCQVQEALDSSIPQILDRSEVTSYPRT